MKEMKLEMVQGAVPDVTFKDFAPHGPEMLPDRTTVTYEFSIEGPQSVVHGTLTGDPRDVHMWLKKIRNMVLGWDEGTD